MDTSIRFTINPDTLGVIGNILPSVKSSLSPLNYGNKGELTTAEKTSLRDTGLVDEHNNVTNKFRPTLEFLAHAKAYARVRIMAWNELLEHIHYFGSDNDQIVSITTQSNGILIQDPAPSEQLGAVLRQNIGTSMIASCTLEAELQVKEALVFAAFIDMHRKRILKAFIEGNKFKLFEYQSSDVLHELQNGIDSPDWLVTMVRNISGFEEALSEDSISTNLKKLTAADLLEENAGKYILAETALSVGKFLLVVENIITLEAGEQIDDEQVVATGFVCMQSGLHCLLLLEHDNGVIRFNGISSAAILTVLEHFLSGSEIL